MTDSVTDQRLAEWIDRLGQGDPRAREQLINVACDRLLKLTRKMLRDSPRIGRWEQTDDVFQNAALRLHRALSDVKPPTVRDFFRLAATQVRRELIDLARHHYGPLGGGANQVSRGRSNDNSESHVSSDVHGADQTHDPDRLAQWTEFHRQIELLPDEEREVFELLWYQELTQAQAAGILGVSERTVKRRWLAGRLKLSEALQGGLPGL